MITVNVKEEGNKIIVNGEYKPSPREKYLAKGFVVPSGGSRCECCLCKLGLQIKHTVSINNNDNVRLVDGSL